MLSTSVCFLTPISTFNRRKSANLPHLRGHPPLCVANERGHAVSTPIQAIITTNKNKRNKSFSTQSHQPTTYHVLPDGATPPPPPAIHYTVPVIGFFLDLIFNKPSVREKHFRFGGVYTSNGLFKRRHFVTDYTAICEMMADSDTFVSRGSFGALTAVLGDQNIGVLDGEPHLRKRVALSSAFSPKLFPFYFQLVQRRVETTCAELAHKSAQGDTVYFDPTFRELFLAVIVEMTTGMECNHQYYANIRRLSARLLRAFSSPSYGPIYDDAMDAKRQLLQLVTDTIQRTSVEHAATIDKLRSYGDKLYQVGTREIGKSQVNILVMLLAANEDIRPGVENDPAIFRAIAMDIVALWFAGYATSAATTTCAAFEMFKDDDIWARLQQEQETIIGECDSRDVEYSQLSQMTLLHSYISEIMRLFPAAPGAFRKCIRDVELFGRHIEKGSFLYFYYAAAMLDETVYPDPEVLKMDRFLAQPGKSPPPRILTFGPPGTPHYCLGSHLSFMLIKATLAQMLRTYSSVKLDPAATTKYSRIPEHVPASKVAVTEIRRRDQN